VQARGIVAVVVFTAFGAALLLALVPLVASPSGSSRGVRIVLVLMLGVILISSVLLLFRSMRKRH
jgi:Na+/melibiose symporter-like transporter